MDKLLCNPQKVATLLLGGAQASEYRTSLAFTPQFPCGVEYGGDPLTFTPLTPIQVYNGCVGELDVPGAMVLVSARVQSAVRDSSGIVRPRAMEDCEPGIQRSQPRVKLRVTHCNRATSLIVDSNSQVVVPAGNVRIEALVPGPAEPDDTLPNLGAWVEYGSVDVGAETSWWDTRLEVMACPVQCCSCGVLTERVAITAGSPQESRILMVPRGARKLSVHAVSLINVVYLSDADANLPAFGSVDFTATDWYPDELFGDVPAILLEDVRAVCP